MLKCVIFDMDGTLADTMPLCVAAFHRSIEELAGVRLTDKEITDTFGPSEEGTIRALLPDKYEEGIALYLRNYEALHPVMCPAPFTGVPAMLEQIAAKGLALGLVTGKGANSLALTLRAIGLAPEVFSHTESGDPLGPSKPAGIGRALEVLGAAPQEALYVGDMVSDIFSSRQAGVPVVAAAWAPGAEGEALKAHGPDYYCETMEELLEIIDALA